MENGIQGNNALFATYGAIIDGNDLWILTEGTDVLLHFDLTSMKLLNYYLIPAKNMVSCAHLKIIKVEDVIYAAPFKGKGLAYFNSKTEEIGNIDVPYEIHELEIKNKFNILTAWKSTLVLVGHAVRGIFYYDLSSQRFIRDTTYLEKIKRAGCEKTGILFSDCYCQRKNKLYLPILGSEFVLEADLEHREYKIYKLRHEKQISLRTIDGYVQNGKEKFLLTTTDDEALVWSPADGVESMEKLERLRGKEKIYVRAFHVGEKNYYIAACERKVFVEKEDSIRELGFAYESRGAYDEAEGYTQFEAVFKNGTEIYFQARSNGQIFRIDTTTDTIHRLDFDVTSEQKKEILRRVCHSRTISEMLIENAGFDLDSFLEMYICK